MLPIALAFELTMLPTKTVPDPTDKLPAWMLAVTLISPPVNMLPPVMLPVAVTLPVWTLLAVMLPVALTWPLVKILPLITLAVADICPPAANHDNTIIIIFV
jgi:hypothetical protein